MFVLRLKSFQMSRSLHIDINIPGPYPLYDLDLFYTRLLPHRYDYEIMPMQFIEILTDKNDQKTIGPENAHLKPDLGALSCHEMTLTLNIHTSLLTS